MIPENNFHFRFINGSNYYANHLPDSITDENELSNYFPTEFFMASKNHDEITEEMKKASFINFPEKPDCTICFPNEEKKRLDETGDQNHEIENASAGTDCILHEYPQYLPLFIARFWQWFWFLKLTELPDDAFYSIYTQKLLFIPSHSSKNFFARCLKLFAAFLCLAAIFCFIYVLGQLAHAIDHLIHREEVLKNVLTLLVISAAFVLGIAFGPAIFAGIFGTLITAASCTVLGVILTPFVFGAAGLLVKLGIWNIGGLIASCFVKGPVADSTQPFETSPNQKGAAHILDGLRSVYAFERTSHHECCSVTPPTTASAIYQDEEGQHVSFYREDLLHRSKTQLVTTIQELKVRSHLQLTFWSILTSFFPNTDASLELAFIDMMAKKILKGEATQTVVSYADKKDNSEDQQAPAKKCMLLYTLSSQDKRYGDLIGLTYQPSMHEWRLIKNK